LTGGASSVAVDSSVPASVDASVSAADELVSLDDESADWVFPAGVVFEAAWSLGVEQAETASATAATAAQAQRPARLFLLNVVRAISP
jgi:hypothetical protein